MVQPSVLVVNNEPALRVLEKDESLVAIDPRSRAVVELARRVARSEATVLISGESGTGKEVLAHYIHRHSRCCEGPFVAINCAAIPENMLEAILFGYEKGAFPGAHQTHPGKFEQAQGGTLLLDEISEMDLDLQAKLLRVLQEREIERLGGCKVIPLEVRILATANRDLREQIGNGQFREDLYYRLLETAFVLGDSHVDLSEVMIASQKAGVSFQAVLQVRNRLISAYQEIMNMQI